VASTDHHRPSNDGISTLPAPAGPAWAYVAASGSHGHDRCGRLSSSAVQVTSTDDVRAALVRAGVAAARAGGESIVGLNRLAAGVGVPPDRRTAVVDRTLDVVQRGL
jgi:hypothetical protein